VQLCFLFLSWYSRYGVFADEVLFWRYRFLRMISLAVWKYPPSLSSLRVAVVPLKSVCMVLAFSIW